jgi:pyridinium-3,5-bisthiocarboxylic acid mononucleotide nickel chelatase
MGHDPPHQGGHGSSHPPAAHEHAHPHDHAHDHASPHDHGHAGEGAGHAHAHATTTASGPLGRGEGKGKTLFLDAFSGVAGDMTIAALVDLGVPFAVLENAFEELPVSGFHAHLGHVHRSGIVATTFDVHVEGKQPERTYGWIDRMLAESGLGDRVKTLARRIFRRLGEAEANVHKMPLEEVHFHEVGGVDAIIDIVGAATAIEWIGASVVATPLPMGKGFVSARHGTLPLPAPAVIDCLRGVPTYAVALDAELVTPTGAAIVASIAERFERWPSFVPERVGWGGGQRELPDRPNLLRAVLGSANPAPAVESHVIVEANVDDMTGELAGHAVSALLGAGALDAWAAPIVMKKGRPGLLIAAIGTSEQSDSLARTVLRETSSIGVRILPLRRVERPRRVAEVTTPYGIIPIKVSTGPYGPAVIKPEFDACARAAATNNVTVREVIAAALEAAKSLPIE